MAREQAKVGAQFTEGTGRLGSESDLRGDYFQSTQALERQGREDNLDLKAPPPTVDAKASQSMDWQKGERPLETWLNEKDKGSPHEKKHESSQIKSSEEVTSPPSYVSLKEEVGGRGIQERDRIKEGIDKIDKREEELMDENKEAKSKTLLGSALKNAGQSINKGIGIDEKELMEKINDMQQKGKNSSRLTPPGKMRP